MNQRNVTLTKLYQIDIIYYILLKIQAHFPIFETHCWNCVAKVCNLHVDLLSFISQHMHLHICIYIFATKVSIVWTTFIISLFTKYVLLFYLKKKIFCYSFYFSFLSYANIHTILTYICFTFETSLEILCLVSFSLVYGIVPKTIIFCNIMYFLYITNLFTLDGIFSGSLLIWSNYIKII